MKRQPAGKRFDYYLMNKLRMKNATGNYLPVLHRLYYMAVLPGSNNLWLALCLYNPLLFDISGKGVVVNAVTGTDGAGSKELYAGHNAGDITEVGGTGAPGVVVESNPVGAHEVAAALLNQLHEGRIMVLG